MGPVPCPHRPVPHYALASKMLAQTLFFPWTFARARDPLYGGTAFSLYVSLLHGCVTNASNVMLTA